MSTDKDSKTHDFTDVKSETSTIPDQIMKTRDLDSETSKPKLKTFNKKSSTPPSPKKVKPPKTGTSEHHLALTPYLRYPMTGLPKSELSKFVPSAFRMYYIVHIMDDSIRKNSYFKRQQDAWHPFISRLYFGILFMIQTIRAEISTGTASIKKKNFYKKFGLTYPPETLPIPGPLVTLFENLGPCTPQSTLEGYITPYIPDLVGPQLASQLIDFTPETVHQLLIPNIPMILGFIHTITSAAPNAIPDYSSPSAFTNAVGHNLNGHAFNALTWTDLERTALMTPGLLYPAETDGQINTNFNLYGPRLNLPVPAAANNIRDIDAFLYLNRDNAWFGQIIQIMENYCEYFVDSKSLSECHTNLTVAPLVTTTLVELSSTTAAENNILTLTHAFPPTGPFTLKAKHSSTERSLPSAAAMLAQSAALNVTFNLPDIPNWNLIGTLTRTRTGPFWINRPIKNQSRSEDTYKTIGSTITKHFCLARPLSK